MSGRGIPFHCLPKTEAGCQMPSANTIEFADSMRKLEAERASDEFVRRLLVYGAEHGLPNITPAQCRARLVPETHAPEITPRQTRSRANCWSKAEDAMLLDMRARGRTWREIAGAIPGRTKNAAATRHGYIRGGAPL